MSRRALLLGLAGASAPVACGCRFLRSNAATAEPGQQPPVAQPPKPPSSPALATAPTLPPDPTTTATAPPAPPAPIDRGAVAARYVGATPTRWGTDLPGLLTNVAAPSPSLALTFDACGGPKGNQVDQHLIDLLVGEQLPATLFLNERWIDANPAEVAQLISNPLFEVANHGTRHVPLSVTGRSAYRIKGTTSPQQVVDEVAGNQDRLTTLLGHPPRYFRSGTAYFDDVAERIVSDLGITPVGFAVNGDAGGTASAANVTKALTSAMSGSVVLMHMNRPGGATRTGLTNALGALRKRNTLFVTLSA